MRDEVYESFRYCYNNLGYTVCTVNSSWEIQRKWKRTGQEICCNWALSSTLATIVTVGKASSIAYCVCFHNLRHWACNAHAPYFHLLPVRSYFVFSHYLTERREFSKITLPNLRVHFDFLHNFCMQHFSF